MDFLHRILILIVVAQQFRILNLKFFKDTWIRQYNNLLKDYNNLAQKKREKKNISL